MKSINSTFNIFSIDTSTTKLSATLYASNKLHTLEELSADHSEKLTVVLDSLLKKSGLKINELNILGVNIGPGSFTGLRIGLCFIRVLADVLKINKVVVTNSFLMLLYEAKQCVSVNNCCKFVTLFPSVKNEFYYCKFLMGEKTFKKVGLESYAKTDMIKKIFRNHKGYYFVLPEEISEFENVFEKVIRVKFSSNIIVKMLLNQSTAFYTLLPPEKLMPFYLRHTYY